MKSKLFAAALLAAVSGMSLAHAAPPATPAPSKSAPAASAPLNTGAQVHTTTSTITSLKGDEMMLKSGRSYRLGNGVKASDLKVGERVTVHYKTENAKRVATQVTRAT